MTFEPGAHAFDVFRIRLARYPQDRAVMQQARDRLINRTKQRRDEQVDVDIPGKCTLFLSLDNQLFQELPALFFLIEQHLGDQAGAFFELHPEHDPVEIPVVHHAVDIAFDQLFHLLDRRQGFIVEQILQYQAAGRHLFAEQQFQQPFLRAEVVGDHGDVDAGFLGNVPNGSAFKPFRGKQAFRDIQNVLLFRTLFDLAHAAKLNKRLNKSNVCLKKYRIWGN